MRKNNKEKKEIMVRFRCTAKFKKRIIKRAKYWGISITDYIISAIINESEVRK